MTEDTRPFIERYNHYYSYHDLDNKVIHWDKACPDMGKNIVKFHSDKFAEYTNFNIAICDKCSEGTTQTLMQGMIATIIGLCMIDIPRMHLVYIDSPSGKHYKMPIYQALRIIRKRNWYFTEVEPILTKKEMIKRLLIFRRKAND